MNRRAAIITFVVTVLAGAACTAIAALGANGIREILAARFDKTTGVFNGCAMTGNAGASDPAKRASNRLKNRYMIPAPANIDRSITLASLTAPGNDRTRFRSDRAVEITAWVSAVKPGGTAGESCNCRERREAFIDTHIELVADLRHTEGADVVVAEVTPRLRYLMAEKNMDWSTAALRRGFLRRKVRIRGWLFFDNEHIDQAANTAPRNRSAWRRTCWEIHPITSIELVK